MNLTELWNLCVERMDLLCYVHFRCRYITTLANPLMSISSAGYFILGGIFMLNHKGTQTIYRG